MSLPKIVTIDIETAPNVAYVWSFFKTHVGAKQVLENSHIMSFAAKTLGDDEVRYMDNRSSDDSKIVAALIKELDEADIVIAHNGNKFDVPKIKGRAAIHGLKPPSPFKVIDTLKVARKHFGFPSNSLEYLTGVFNCETKKLSHSKFPGFELWLECLRGNEEAWDEIKEYNIADVVSLEDLYMKMRPWINDHPNIGVYTDDAKSRCPKCGSNHIAYRGYYHTNLSRFHRFQCKDCGAWGRDRTNCIDKEDRKSLATNAL